MRKIIFITLIVIVAGVIGFFTWREFQIPGINHVADYTTSDAATHLKVHRLHAAQVDIEAYEAELEKITLMTEYTDEQKVVAAIASGKPSFIPTFSMGVNKIEGGIQIAGFVGIDYAPNQRENRFKIGNISLESIITDGDLDIDNVSVFKFTDDSPITKIHSDKQAAFDITDATRFNIDMKGERGNVTLQYVYSVTADTLIPRTVMTEQVLLLHLEIDHVNSVILGVDFTIEPYSNLEELNAD